MISIIIPVYNGEKFLEKTITSALSQVIDEDFEIIIIDDSSNDQSYELAIKLSNSDKRIQLYRNSKNLGACRTFNEGIKKAQGEYVMVLGQDDLIDKHHCQKMLPILKNDNKVAVVFCDYYMIDENDLILDEKKHCLQHDITTKNLMLNNAMPSCGAILRKEYVNKVGGYPEFQEFPQYGEWYLWILLSECWSIKFCKDIHAFYRRHCSNMTNSFSDKKTKTMLEKYWYICRTLALKSKNLSVVDKLKLIFYMYVKLLKSKTNLV